MIIGKRRQRTPNQEYDLREDSTHLSAMKKMEWGLCVIDEVHKLPAQKYRSAFLEFKFHIKIGLTATPYREDNKIEDLFYIIGPKLHEENLLDLINEGYLARPYCIEINCDMSPLFKEKYGEVTGSERDLIHTANSQKYFPLYYLIKIHQDRGDQIIVFCQRTSILEVYARSFW